jgi:outer membrane protein assembly factor BamB
LGTCRILALDITTGKTTWRLDIGLGYHPVSLSMDDGELFVKAAGKFVKAINPVTGQELPNRIRSSYWDILKNAGNTFVVGGGCLFVQNKYAEKEDHHIVCYDLDSGEELWRKVGYCFYPEFYANDTLYATHTESKGFAGIQSATVLTAIEPRSGKEKWRTESCVFARRLVLASRGRIFLQCRDGAMYILDAATGRAIWHMRQEVADKQKIRDTYLYALDNENKAILVLNELIYYFVFNN